MINHKFISFSFMYWLAIFFPWSFDRYPREVWRNSSKPVERNRVWRSLRSTHGRVFVLWDGLWSGKLLKRFRNFYRVSTGQEIVRKRKGSSRSEESLGVLFWVRENEIYLTLLIWYHWRWNKHLGSIVITVMFFRNEKDKFVENMSVICGKDSVLWGKLETATVSDILSLFGQANLILYE